ncbi:MAG: 6,7-dimethyl-8-ribityllumazine synthase [Candidatus Sumerlaeota bacterium]|nr:6,7-dimethyl-8-ribityllumazine synthase [Candidatus Sumerlaeota bacterium]
MPKTFEGQLNAKDMRFAIVASRFNEFFVSKLIDGALDCLRRHGASDEGIAIYRVPGSFEIPAAAAKIARAPNRPDAIICLGAVIKGETAHNVYIANEVTKGIAQVGLETGVPVAYGVITPDSLEQAIERAGSKAGNKGAEAALSAIEMVSLFRAAGL